MTLNDDLRAELAGVAASLRAYLEVQVDSGATGIPRARAGTLEAARLPTPTATAIPAAPATPTGADPLTPTLSQGERVASPAEDHPSPSGRGAGGEGAT